MACAPGSTSAKVGGRRRCLKAGQRCRNRWDREYHRYRFHCHVGRLEAFLPSAGRIVANIQLRPGPMGAISAGGAIWVAEHRNDTIARVDPGTNRVVGRISIPSGSPSRFAVGPEGLWHLPYSDNSVQQLDPATNSVSAQISSIGEPDENCCSLAVGAGSVWVPNAHDGLYRIDAVSHQVTARIPIDKFFGSVFGLGSVWAISGGDVLRINSATNGVTRIPVPGLAAYGVDANCCPAIGVGAGALWVAFGTKVVRIDPATNTIVASLRLPGAAEFIEVTDAAVWVVGKSPTSPTRLWRVDPPANKVTASLSLGREGEAAEIVAGAGSLWITLFNTSRLLRIQPAAPLGG
jgi:streptogramin lyase